MEWGQSAPHWASHIWLNVPFPQASKATTRLTIEAPEADLKDFLAACSRTEPKTVACSLFSEFNRELVNKTPVVEILRLPSCLYKDLYKPGLTIPLEMHCDKEFKRLQNSVTHTEIDYLESMTRKQALNRTWIEHRAGRITASNAHAFMYNQSHVAPSTIRNITQPSYSTHIRTLGRKTRQLCWRTSVLQLSISKQHQKRFYSHHLLKSIHTASTQLDCSSLLHAPILVQA